MVYYELNEKEHQLWNEWAAEVKSHSEQTLMREVADLRRRLEKGKVWNMEDSRYIFIYSLLCIMFISIRFSLFSVVTTRTSS